MINASVFEDTLDQMKFRFRMIIIVLSAIALTSFLLIGYQININDITNDITEEAARQKTLILYSLEKADELVHAPNDEAALITRKELLVIAQELRKNFETLKAGEHRFFAKVEPSKEVLGMIKDPPYLLDARVGSFTRELEELSNTPSHELTEINVHLENINTFVNKGKLIEYLDAFSVQYKKDQSKKTDALKYLNIINFVVLILIIFLSGFFVFKPLIEFSEDNVAKVTREFMLREKTEKRLKANEKKLKAILSGIHESIITFSANGEIEFLNEANEKMFQYLAPSLINKHVELIIPNVVKEGEKTPLIEYLSGAELDGEVLSQVSVEGVKKNGDTFQGQMSLNRSEVLGEILYTAILWDVSKEIREQKNKELFVATLTHDLKTPIKAEYRVFEEMQRGSFGKLNDGVNDVINELIKSNRYMYNMVENLLANYKMAEGEIELRKSPVEVNQLITELVEGDLSLLADEKGHKVYVELDEQVERVYLDQVEITRVLYNLMQNAINYCPRGSEICVSSQKLGNAVEIAVEDNGPGISDEQMPKLFKPFQSVAKKYKQVGTGLGLYLSKKVIEAHGGEIHIKSKPDEGTRFYFTLPI